MCVPDGDCAQDVADFSWDDYLEETEAVAVPHHAFKHVRGKFFSLAHDCLLSGCLEDSDRFSKLCSNMEITFK